MRADENDPRGSRFPVVRVARWLLFVLFLAGFLCWQRFAPNPRISRPKSAT